MYTVNGIGTTCYGKANPVGDTFVATEWFVLVFFPIWPIRSRRMRVIGKDSAFLGWTTRYQTFEHVSFADNLGQVALTWAWTLVPLAVLVLLPALASPMSQPGFFPVVGYFAAVAAFLGFAASRPGRRALTEGWQSVAGLMLLTLVLYAWPLGSVRPWFVRLPGGFGYAPETHIIGGALLFTALAWCGGVRRLTALGWAIILALLTSAIDIVVALGRGQLANDPSSQMALGIGRNELWSAALLLAACGAVPSLRRGYYWLIQLGIPAVGGLASSLVTPITLPLLYSQSPWTRWAVLASPFILTKTLAFGLLGSWVRQARGKA